MVGVTPEPRTLAEKVWDAHVVRTAAGEPDLLYIDLHLLHEVTSPQAFDGLRLAGRRIRRSGPAAVTCSPSRTRPPVRRSRRCAATAPSSASGCTRSATRTRASCTSS